MDEDSYGRFPDDSAVEVRYPRNQRKSWVTGERAGVTRRPAGLQGCHAPARFGRDPRCLVRGRSAGAVFAR